jgi:hypothetical protein
MLPSFIIERRFRFDREPRLGGLNSVPFDETGTQLSIARNYSTRRIRVWLDRGRKMNS